MVGENPTCPVPVLSRCEGLWSCDYDRAYMVYTPFSPAPKTYKFTLMRREVRVYFTQTWRATAAEKGTSPMTVRMETAGAAISEGSGPPSKNVTSASSLTCSSSSSSRNRTAKQGQTYAYKKCRVASFLGDKLHIQ